MYWNNFQTKAPWETNCVGGSKRIGSHGSYSPDIISTYSPVDIKLFTQSILTHLYAFACHCEIAVFLYTLEVAPHLVKECV